MSEVVNFPGAPPDEMVILCECGCRTFMVLSTGWLECSNCKGRLEDDVTAYTPERIKEVPKPEVTTENHILPDISIALRRVLRRANTTDAAAVVVMGLDGKTDTWSIGYEEAEHEAWFQSRVDHLMEDLK